MKKLQVTIMLDMEVPDAWTLFEHPDGLTVLDIGDGKFMDITYIPMTTSEAQSGATWSSAGQDEFISSVLDMIQGEETVMEMMSVQ
ncbi:hypothetical protein GALL_349800 [mine drainage metagenome]|uniref:Uncharacterized protein n=1 Tax=mine drainage metagenome TaxID=410659 RepID=A0A1J5QI50_9ZZZZ